MNCDYQNIECPFQEKLQGGFTCNECIYANHRIEPTIGCSWTTIILVVVFIALLILSRYC